MEEKDTYQRVAIPMTDKQAHEVFACETCKGFSESLKRLKVFIDYHCCHDTVNEWTRSEYLEHLNLVASPDCDGQCVTGETMSIQCPCCKDRVHLNYYCYLPTEFQCPYCSADLTGPASGEDALGIVVFTEQQKTIRRIIKNHNMMKGDLVTPFFPKSMLERPSRRSATDVRGFGVPMQENEES